MRPELLLVICSELLLGEGKIRGGGQVKRFLTERLGELKAIFEKNGKKIKQTKVAGSALPRYVRINSSRWKTTQAAIAHLKSKGISELKVDEDIPNLLVMDSKYTKTLVTLDSVKKGDLILQDKSTCVSAFALLKDRPTGRIHVMDVCAAPGGKTIHILEMLKPGDSLTAIEMDEKRAKVLEERIAALGDSKKGVTVKVINIDFLKLFPEEYQLGHVTHINLDPSCSGSGMEGPNTKGEKQLQQLASFQSMMLKHAQNAFEKVDTICYSTCSVHSIENELVIKSVLSPAFRLDTQPLPAWWTTTSEDGFIKTTPESHNCRGFFLAKLVRV
jgi:putative methyltransferase